MTDFRREPEVGQLEAERERRAREAQAWTSSPGLGSIDRRCVACQSEWPAGAIQCPECGGNVFAEKPIEAAPVTGYDRIKGWLTQSPPADAPAVEPDAEQLAAFRRLDGLLAATLEALTAAEQAAGRLVDQEGDSTSFHALRRHLHDSADVGGDITATHADQLGRAILSMRFVLSQVHDQGAVS